MIPASDHPALFRGAFDRGAAGYALELVVRGETIEQIAARLVPSLRCSRCAGMGAPGPGH